MNWFEKIGAALRDKFGVNFTETTTEAELAEMIEQLQGVEELQAENTQLNERIDVLESLHTENEAKLAATIERANNNAAQLQEIQGKVDLLTNSIAKIEGRSIQNGHDNSQPAFTRTEAVAHEAIKRFEITVNK